MTDVFKDFVQSLQERIRSPILSSVLLSLILWNWKALYLLFVSNVPAIAAIWYVQSQSDFVYSILIPSVSGVAIALAIPFITTFGAYAASRPKFWLFKLEQEQNTRSELERLRIQGEKEKALAVLSVEANLRLEEQALQRAKLDQRITEERLAPEIAKNLQKQIDELRTKPALITRQGSISDVNYDAIAQSLSEKQKEMLLGVKEQGEGTEIYKRDYIGGSNISAGKLRIDKRNVSDRVWQEYVEAISDLDSLNLIRGAVGKSSSSWEVTSKGYKVIDCL